MSRPRRRRAPTTAPGGGARAPDYRHLRNPFMPQTAFSDDRAAALHEAALRVLEELGIKVLLLEAAAILARGGARVAGDDLVFIGRDLVEAALASAPKRIHVKGGAPHRDQVLELGTLSFMSGAGTPHATDLLRGRRPASLQDYRELTQLSQAFDVLHYLNPLVEPQDTPVHTRHYDVTRAQMTLSDKIPFIFARGTPQAQDCFEIIRLARGVDHAAFAAAPYCYTIINTNSPRQLDRPMAQGLIDFARAGQLSIVTPFCLMGAMAPVSVAGALVLSHAEALAAIVLTQMTRAGAPVMYGAFASNVDMKSGAPAFGTPEQVQANLGAGQLARLTGLPWRSAAGCAANVNDAQAAHETQMSAWSAVLAGASVVVHGAGWLEGGLTLSYEKMITDIEMLQIFAELCRPVGAEEADLAFDALSEVQPGGHFFAAAHTMDRYKAAFYEPLIADWSNFGTWSERGALDANTRATALWQSRLETAQAPDLPLDRRAAIDAFIAQRIAAGGAPPVS
ncbi:MAG: trimethylamine methyltransferase family protein [Pseudomonadota bacterium]